MLIILDSNAWDSAANASPSGDKLHGEQHLKTAQKDRHYRHTRENSPTIRTDRHPRTAIAKLQSGKLLLLTVDGRQPGVSAGMSLNMLAELLLEFGAVEAINLDGGVSTSMVVGNKLVNRPSDQTGERPV